MNITKPNPTESIPEIPPGLKRDANNRAPFMDRAKLPTEADAIEAAQKLEELLDEICPNWDDHGGA